MKSADRASFAQLLSDAMAFYRQDVSQFALSVWWQACERWELSDVAKALTQHAMDADRGQFAPKPADIVRQLQGTQADRSLIAWGKVYDAMQRLGAYTSVAFDDGAIHAAIDDMGGWVKVCRSTSDELPFVQKRFCDAHKAYTARAGDVQFPAVLYGEHDIQNQVAGYVGSAPVLVGSAQKASEVMLSGVRGGKTNFTTLPAPVVPRLGSQA